MVLFKKRYQFIFMSSTQLQNFRDQDSSRLLKLAFSCSKNGVMEHKVVNRVMRSFLPLRMLSRIQHLKHCSV